MQSLPRDMLFCMRNIALVRGLNQELGGSSRSRFNVLAECAIRGLTLSDKATEEASNRAGDRKSEAQLRLSDDPEVADVVIPHPPGFGDSHNLNEPVASEIKKGYKDSLGGRLGLAVRVWQLRTRLWLLDHLASWSMWWYGDRTYSAAQKKHKDIG